jgi:hypothetical protein
MGTRNGAVALPANDTRSSDWVEAHAALSRLAQQRAALDAEEGRWLLCALRSAAHVYLGFGSFAEYIEQLFGYRPRTTQEKLRVAEAMEILPHVASALESGAVSWCAARELTRVVVPDTERAWIDAARGKTQRELEALVASKDPGDAPDAPATESPRPRVLRFEVAPDTFATFRAAMQGLQHTAGGHLDDDALLLAMARHVLGGPQDAGRSSYQISLAVCSTCGGGAQLAGGELVPIDPAVVTMAACDAQRLGEVLHNGADRSANQNANRGPLHGADRSANQNANRGPRDGTSEATRAENTAARRCSDHVHVGTERQPESDAAMAPRHCCRSSRLVVLEPVASPRGSPPNPARSAKHPTGSAPRRARARPALPSAGLHPRYLRRRSPHPAALRRRVQRSRESPTVLGPPSRDPLRRATHRARPRRVRHLPARRWCYLRSRGRAAKHRCPDESLLGLATPRLSRR